MAEPPEGDDTLTAGGSAAGRQGGDAGADRAASAPAFPGLEVLEEMGSGGMGHVYRARDPNLDRIVAVKTVKEHLLTPAGRSFFVDEARVVARLNHPNIVKIHGFNPDNQPPYYVMEFVEGRPLSDACEGRGPMFVASVMEKVARALAYAHARGVLHGDIKPANILVDYQNEPHLTDFGLARQWEETAASVEGAEIADATAPGTPQFLAPELLQGASPPAPTVDIYAFGVTLYRLLTGRYPFAGATWKELRHSALDSTPPLPQEVNPSVPEPLQRICLKAMERDQQARYQSAQVMAEDLRRFREGREVFAQPTRYEADLRGKLQNHVTEVQLWHEHHLIDAGEKDQLIRPYRRLMASEFPWHDRSRRLPWAAALLRLSGWLILIGSILWPVFYWDQLDRHERVLSVGVGMLVLSALGWLFYRRWSRFSALAFLSVGALLLSLFTAVVLMEYQLARSPQPPALELFGEWASPAGGPASGPAGPTGLRAPLAPTNTQLILAADVFLAYVLVLLAWTRERAMIAWVVLGGCALLTMVLFRLGLKEWLSSGHVARVLACYLGLALALLLLAVTLERRGQMEWAGAFYAFFPLPLAVVLTLLAKRGAVEWFGAADDWQDESVGFWLMANSLAYLAAGLWSVRSRAPGIQRWSALLLWLVGVSLLVPPILLYRKGETLALIYGQPLTTYGLIAVLVAAGLIVLGTRLRRYSLAMSGFAGLAAILFLITATCFQGQAWWPLALTATGAAGVAAAVVLSVAKTRRRRRVL